MKTLADLLHGRTSKSCASVTQEGTYSAAVHLGHFILAPVILGLEAAIAPPLTGWVTLSLRVLIVNGNHNPTPKGSHWGENEGYGSPHPTPTPTGSS